MKALTAKLLAGSGVSEASHPGLVSLLELAAAGPGIPKGSALDTPALRKRLLRDWKRVCAAFRACIPLSLTDAHLWEHLPSGYGISHDVETGWVVSGSEPLQYRAYIANVLQALTPAVGGDKLSPEELKVLMGAFGSAIAGERALLKALRGAGYTVYGAGVAAYIETLSGTKKQIKEDNS